jgi:predicted RNase H-like HicB family nuclease
VLVLPIGGRDAEDAPFHRHHQKGGDGYVSLCPELDVASQGHSVEGARANLKEAVELLFETADPTEIAQPLHGEVRLGLGSHGPRPSAAG